MAGESTSVAAVPESAQRDYLQLVRWVLLGKEFPCVTLGIPARHIDAVLGMVHEEYPRVRCCVLTQYGQSGRVLFWSVPDSSA